MVMEAQPSPQSVGREFVRQYYTLLNKAPDHLYRFYNNSSSFVHGGLDSKNQEATLVIGQKQIHNKIQQLNFRDCHAKISQVDSQATLGNGVVVQVTGELSNDGQPMRRFTQTFVLAAQSPKKYYVHNDIFRYQDVYSDDEIDENERSGGEDEGDVDNNLVVDNQNIPANVAPVVVAPTIGLQQQPQQQQQQQPPQQQQQQPQPQPQPQQQLYYPPGVMSAAPAGIIPSYGQQQQAQQPQQQQQQQQPQQLNGVHDDLLKTVPTQTPTQLIQPAGIHPSVGVVPSQTPIIQQLPNVATGIPTVEPIQQHLAQQQQQMVQPQPTHQQLQPQQIPQQLPQPPLQQQPSPIPEPEPIPSTLTMNELDASLPSIIDPTPAEASDLHDHHHLSHGPTDYSDQHPSLQSSQQSQQQQITNEPKTYANLVKSGGSGVGGPGPLSFASVSSHHHQQQQSQQQQQQQQQQQHQHHQQSYNNVTAGRQSVLSPPPSSTLQSSSSGAASSGPTSNNNAGLMGNKYDRQQQQDQIGLGQGGPMPQRMQNQQRPIRGNGPPTGTGGNGQSTLRQQQDGRPTYQRSYNDGGEDRRQSNAAQFGDNHQLFLGNIPHHATEEELKALFSKYGAVVDLRIHSKPGQKMPGVRAPPYYGFITYEDPASVQNCLADMPLYFPENCPDGQKLNVEEKKTRTRAPGETGGRIGGSNLGGNGSNGPRGGPGGPGGQQRGLGGPQGNMNRGGSGQRGLGGVGGGSGRGGYPRSDRGSVSGGGGGQRSGNGNYR
ncbi:ras GTPase-activating protein-binding protein 1 isoform X2 [Toxorhynchites rutilus septentrionalis]|uniref:ras GTPase-activating protein-binding protein 1 isoform X2 n=1 Tax=Toxorhynchites rutilus septentrionalis TaxID=329112 RepID=UPI002478D67D|nr:ras GTPase-activating protein-binding protein 1 isoform X2 [Toxorhynchites rutilus septentrionalis]